MTIDQPGRGALRARLEWIRLMGIEDLRVASAPSAAPGAVAAPRDSAVQTGLFGDSPIGEDVEASKPGRGRGRSGPGAFPGPLASVRAPQAPDPASALRLIREEIGDCRRCRLCEQRTTIVFGLG